jgi:protein tyrosine/serine phosphatase
MRRSVFSAVVAVALLAALGACVARPPLRAAGGEPKAADRPANWAVPIEKLGLPNLHRVSDQLYRGAQPTAEGFRELKKMGIKTVVSLRSLHSDRELLGDTGLAYEQITMTAWHAETEDVVRFLKIVADKEKTPVFVHCQQGADRTGTLCAVYRVVVCGWSKEEAIREMKEGGFGHHSIFKNLPRFIEELDVEAIKKEAGLTKE